MTGHRLSAEPARSVWDRSLPPTLPIEPGDQAACECVEASGGQLYPATTMAPCLSIDRTRIHALSGPVRVQGTGPGDLVKVDVFSTGLAGQGWSSVVEGLGFLKSRFREPYLFHWQLENQSTSWLRAMKMRRC